jgi:hypothetical protein
MEQLDITKLSIQELKSLAYDEILKFEIAQRNIKTLQAEIAKKSEPVASDIEVKDLADKGT